MVVHDLDLYVLVTQVIIIVPKKHDLVLVAKPIVEDGHICRTPSYIKETILTLVYKVYYSLAKPLM